MGCKTKRSKFIQMCAFDKLKEFEKQVKRLKH